MSALGRKQRSSGPCNDRRRPHDASELSQPAGRPQHGDTVTGYGCLHATLQPEPEVATIVDNLLDSAARHPPASMHSKAVYPAQLSFGISQAHQDQHACLRPMRADVMVFHLQRSQIVRPLGRKAREKWRSAVLRFGRLGFCLPRGPRILPFGSALDGGKGQRH